MTTSINNLISNLHNYDQSFHRPINDLIEVQNISIDMYRLEKVSEDLQSHQWKKIGLYITAGALIISTAVLAVLFFKFTLPYIIAHFGMGIGDALGILGGGHAAATFLPLAGLKPIYDRLTVDSKIERLKNRQGELKSRIEEEKGVEKAKNLRGCLVAQKMSNEKRGLNVSSLVTQIVAIDKLLSAFR